MKHSQMLQTRRRKQAGKKVLARVAKLEKKTKGGAVVAGSGAPRAGSEVLEAAAAV
jgi:hypothetical protein